MILGMYKFITTTITYLKAFKTDFCFKIGFFQVTMYVSCFCHSIDAFLKAFNGYIEYAIIHTDFKYSDCIGL